MSETAPQGEVASEQGNEWMDSCNPSAWRADEEALEFEARLAIK